MFSKSKGSVPKGDATKDSPFKRSKEGSKIPFRAPTPIQPRAPTSISSRAPTPMPSHAPPPMPSRATPQMPSRGSGTPSAPGSRSYVPLPTSGRSPQRLELPESGRDGRKSPGSSPLAQRPQLYASDINKPLPSPPMAQIVNPMSPPKARRTLIDAFAAGTPTEAEFPVLKPVNLEVTAEVDSHKLAMDTLKSRYTGVADTHRPRPSALPISTKQVKSHPGALHLLGSALPPSPIGIAHGGANDSPLVRKQRRRAAFISPSTEYSLVELSQNPLPDDPSSSNNVPVATRGRIGSLRPGSTRYPKLGVDLAAGVKPSTSESLGVNAKAETDKDSKQKTPVEAPHGTAESAKVRPSSSHQQQRRDQFHPSANQHISTLNPDIRSSVRLSSHSLEHRSGLGAILTISDDADDVLLEGPPDVPAIPDTLPQKDPPERTLSALAGRISKSTSRLSFMKSSRSATPPVPESANTATYGTISMSELSLFSLEAVDSPDKKPFFEKADTTIGFNPNESVFVQEFVDGADRTSIAKPHDILEPDVPSSPQLESNYSVPIRAGDDAESAIVDGADRTSIVKPHDTPKRDLHSSSQPNTPKADVPSSSSSNTERALPPFVFSSPQGPMGSSQHVQQPNPSHQRPPTPPVHSQGPQTPLKPGDLRPIPLLASVNYDPKLVPGDTPKAKKYAEHNYGLRPPHPYDKKMKKKVRLIQSPKVPSISEAPFPYMIHEHISAAMEPGLGGMPPQVPPKSDMHIMNAMEPGLGGLPSRPAVPPKSDRRPGLGGPPVNPQVPLSPAMRQGPPRDPETYPSIVIPRSQYTTERISKSGDVIKSDDAANSDMSPDSLQSDTSAYSFARRNRRSVGTFKTVETIQTESEKSARSFRLLNKSVETVKTGETLVDQSAKAVKSADAVKEVKSASDLKSPKPPRVSHFSPDQSSEESRSTKLKIKRSFQSLFHKRNPKRQDDPITPTEPSRFGRHMYLKKGSGATRKPDFIDTNTKISQLDGKEGQSKVPSAAQIKEAISRLSLPEHPAAPELYDDVGSFKSDTRMEVNGLYPAKYGIPPAKAGIVGKGKARDHRASGVQGKGKASLSPLSPRSPKSPYAPGTPIPTMINNLLERVQTLPASSHDRIRALDIAQAIVTCVESTKEAKIAAHRAEQHAHEAELHASTAHIALDRLQKLVRPDVDTDAQGALRALVGAAGLPVPYGIM